MDRSYAPQTSPQLSPQSTPAAPTSGGWGNQDAAASLAVPAAPVTCGPESAAWYERLLVSPQATARALLFGPYLGDLDGFRTLMDEARTLAAADLSNPDPTLAAAAAALPDQLLVAEMCLGIPGVLGPAEWAAFASGLDDPQRAEATAAFIDAFFGEAACDVFSDIEAHRAATAPQEEPDFFDEWSDAIGSEGISAVFDPEGGIDQMYARQELASRFQIVEEEGGERAPNAVTQDEFDEIVELYSDIRLGETSLGIDTSGLDAEAAEAFKRGTMDDLADLLQTPAGRQVVGELAEEDEEFGRTWIRPAASPSEAGCKNSTQAGKTIEDGRNWVEYVPGATVDLGSELPWDQIRSDVALMHELTHAWYQNQGIYGFSRVTEEEDPTGRDRTSLGLDGKPPVVARTTQFEYQGVGLGQWASSPVSENAYRAQRDALEGEPGALERDGELGQRDSYHAHAGG